MQSLLGVLAGPWTLYIIWVLLSEGPHRFSALRKRVSGITPKILTERLRLLETEGFVYRRYEPAIPPQVIYGPTERMRQLHMPLCKLSELAAEWHKADSSSAQA
jgi:DNA-binding HxlR family transcriptional regulator